MLISILLVLCIQSISKTGPSQSWSYCSQIYNYLCNRCLSSLRLFVRILLMDVWQSLISKSTFLDFVRVLCIQSISLMSALVYCMFACFCKTFLLIEDKRYGSLCLLSVIKPCIIVIYYTLRFYFPYLSLLAQPVNIALYGPGLDCLVFDSVPERYLHYYFR